MPADRLLFPDGFVWGTATASYQIEGAVHEDGRGVSIWDTFSHSGRVTNNDNGDVAVDHYHRWEEDIKLMQNLNISAYRFSIAWPRIIPQGRGVINELGIDYYSRLVDGLLDAGITPYVTLYHWDLPQPLQDEGGWLRRGIADDFVTYADVVTRALGDRVKHWITFNEPWVFTWLGYVFGVHAPGTMSGNPKLAMDATHHCYLAHGRTVPVIRANVPDAVVGITLNLNHVDPASPVPHDLAAAARFDGSYNRWYLDPIFKGTYPHDIVSHFPEWAPDVQAGDMDTIAAPIDFLGINYYTRAVIADEPEQFGGIKQIVPPEDSVTAMGWEVYPEGLYTLLRRIHEEYSPKAIYITENGAAYYDEVSADGEVHDPKRVEYLRGHFEAASRAIEDGVPLVGYFVWSLMDNFEWAEGYAKRFGIHYVDFATQQRIIKDSGRFLAEVAARVGMPTK